MVLKGKEFDLRVESLFLSCLTQTVFSAQLRAPKTSRSPSKARCLPPRRPVLF